jgi:hypothetical protein
MNILIGLAVLYILTATAWGRMVLLSGSILAILTYVIMTR